MIHALRTARLHSDILERGRVNYHCSLFSTVFFNNRYFTLQDQSKEMLFFCEKTACRASDAVLNISEHVLKFFKPSALSSSTKNTM